MRIVLQAMYRLSAWVAAGCLLTILGLVTVQVCARLLDWALVVFGGTAVGFLVPSLAEIAGFLLGAATFLALAGTLAAGVHIRVNLVTERLPERARDLLDGIVSFVAAGLSAYAAYALSGFAWRSYQYNDVSYGMVQVPLALPQAVMAFGLIVLTLALLDDAYQSFAHRRRPAGAEGGI